MIYIISETTFLFIWKNMSLKLFENWFKKPYGPNKNKSAFKCRVHS